MLNLWTHKLRMLRVVLSLGWIALILAGVFIARIPVPPSKILVPANSWRVQSGFSTALPPTHIGYVSPPTGEIPASIARDNEARFWTSRSSGAGAKSARIETEPFPCDSTHIGVPLNGMARHPKISVYLEEISSGEQIH